MKRRIKKLWQQVRDQTFGVVPLMGKGIQKYRRSEKPPVRRAPNALARPRSAGISAPKKAVKKRRSKPGFVPRR